MAQNPFYDNPPYQVDLKQHQVQQDDVDTVHGGGGQGAHGEEGQAVWSQTPVGVSLSQGPFYSNYQVDDKLPCRINLGQHQVQQDDVHRVHEEDGLGVHGKEEESQVGWGEPRGTMKVEFLPEESPIMIARWTDMNNSTMPWR